jgi:hypothetical protein
MWSWLTRKWRGIRWPEVELLEPNAKDLPLSCSGAVIPLCLLAMNTLLNSRSMSRMQSGTAPVMTRACTWVKPPSQAKSTLPAESAWTAAP